jgi:hypothetical protein
MATVPHARICVFHNGDNGEVLSYLKTNFPDNIESPQESHIIHSNTNVGWGKAINLAMDILKPDTEYILLSNDDVEYGSGWFEKCLALYDKYPKIGILGVWKHKAHGVKQDLGDMLVKDDMPAVGWLLKKSTMDIIGPLGEHGPCLTKGGNGEDTNYAMRAIEKGYWVCGPKDDVAQHIDVININLK